MRNDRSQAKLYKNHYKQDLPFSSWLEGFDIFIAIYVETAKSSTQYVQLTQELLTYKHLTFSKTIMTGPDSQLRPDLHLQYAVNSPKEQFRPARPIPAPPKTPKTDPRPPAEI